MHILCVCACATKNHLQAVSNSANGIDVMEVVCMCKIISSGALHHSQWQVGLVADRDDSLESAIARGTVEQWEVLNDMAYDAYMELMNA